MVVRTAVEECREIGRGEMKDRELTKGLQKKGDEG